MSDTETDVLETTHTDETSNETEGSSAPPDPLEAEFSTKTWRHDLTMIVEDKPLYVSTCMLAFSSPVFKTMFSGEFKEMKQEEVTLADKKFDDFVEFLKFIYPGTMKSVTLSNALKVYPLAYEYRVQNLMSACEVYLLQHLSQNERPEKLYEIMEMASAYKLYPLKEKCIEIIAELPEEEFEELKRKYTFPDDVMNGIRTKILQSLKTKYKDVFGHVKTSRALYHFLGREAKQNNLVVQYMTGQVIGGVVNLKVNSPTFRASTELCIGSYPFSLHVVTSNSLFSEEHIVVQVELQSIVQRDPINCLSAVYILNWMKGKENKGHKLEGHKEVYFDKCQNISLTDCVTSLLSNEEAGFIYKGTIDVCIYLFCWRNV